LSIAITNNETAKYISMIKLDRTNLVRLAGRVAYVGGSQAQSKLIVTAAFQLWLGNLLPNGRFEWVIITS